MSEYLEKSKSYKSYHYSILTKDMLDYLHRRTLEMFKEVVKIFKRHGIPYMIVGGTLLGAVTQKKFIPWDDDLDVCVFEDDYEKVKDVLIAELPVGGGIAVRQDGAALLPRLGKSPGSVFTRISGHSPIQGKRCMDRYILPERNAAEGNRVPGCIGGL